MTSAGIRARNGIALIAANLLVLSALLVLGEVGVRWRTEGGLREAFGSFFHNRTPLSQLDTGGWLVHDVDLGYKLNPTHVGVNSLGIRHAELAPGRSAAGLRVIVLGDSIAWDPQGFVTLLRNHFGHVQREQVEVINAAIPGYTTYQERRLLERDLLVLEPDLVILQYCVNDNHRFLHFLNKTGKWLVTPDVERALLTEGTGCIERMLSSSYLWFEIKSRLVALKLRPQGRFPWQDRADLVPAWLDASWADFEDHFRAMRDLLRRIDARLAVVAVPLEDQLRPDLLGLDRSYTLAPQRHLAEICERDDVPLLDLFAAFNATRDQRLYIDGLHLSAAGHQVVERELIDFIERHALLDGRPRARRSKPVSTRCSGCAAVATALVG